MLCVFQQPATTGDADGQKTPPPLLLRNPEAKRSLFPFHFPQQQTTTMAGLGGGIGRFARKKHQLSQQDAPVTTTSSASSSAEDFHHHSGEEERPAETEFDTAATLATMKIIAPAMKNGNAAVEDADTAGNDLYGDRPETPFNSFANDGFVPPATPGGSFSAIDQMFDSMGDDDDQHDTEGCNDRMEGMFVDTMQAANDGDDTAESNFGQQGLSFGCDNLRGFSSFSVDSTPNAGEELQQNENGKSCSLLMTSAVYFSVVTIDCLL